MQLVHIIEKRIKQHVEREIVDTISKDNSQKEKQTIKKKIQP